MTDDPTAGEKIDILYDGYLYRTRVDGVLEDGTLFVSVPTHRGLPLPARRGMTFQILYYRYNGKFSISAEVTDVLTEGSVKIMVIKLSGDTCKQQHREYFRLPVSLDAIVYSFPNGDLPEPEDTDTQITENSAVLIDISVTGALIDTNIKYNLGEHIILETRLGWPRRDSPPIQLESTVARTADCDDDSEHNRIGLRFHRNAAIQSQLGKYIMEKQREKIRDENLLKRDLNGL